MITWEYEDDGEDLTLPCRHLQEVDRLCLLILLGWMATTIGGFLWMA